MTYVDDAFANLKHTLEITQTESQSASRRHQQLRDRVRDAWQLDDDFLTGSYRRNTRTRSRLCSPHTMITSRSTMLPASSLLGPRRK
jgi:hypothetical protein